MWQWQHSSVWSTVKALSIEAILASRIGTQFWNLRFGPDTFQLLHPSRTAKRSHERAHWRSRASWAPWGWRPCRRWESNRRNYCSTQPQETSQIAAKSSCICSEEAGLSVDTVCFHFCFSLTLLHAPETCLGLSDWSSRNVCVAKLWPRQRLWRTKILCGSCERGKPTSFFVKSVRVTRKLRKVLPKRMTSCIGVWLKDSRSTTTNFGRAGRKFRSFLNVSASKAGGFKVNFVENASKVASSWAWPRKPSTEVCLTRTNS